MLRDLGPIKQLSPGTLVVIEFVDDERPLIEARFDKIDSKYPPDFIKVSHQKGVGQEPGNKINIDDVKKISRLSENSGKRRETIWLNRRYYFKGIPNA